MFQDDSDLLIDDASPSDKGTIDLDSPGTKCIPKRPRYSTSDEEGESSAQEVNSSKVPEQTERKSCTCR